MSPIYPRLSTPYWISGLLLTILLTSSCTHSAPVSRPPAHSDENQQESFSNLLEQLSSSDQAELSRLSHICQPAVQKRGEKLKIGCACCAPFDVCPPTGTEPIFRSTEDRRIYSLRQTLTGSFTIPDADQNALVFEGCEAGAENRGGTMIYSAKSDRFQPVAYRSGINPDQCLVLRGDSGIDQLACLTRQEMGGTSYHLLELIHLNEDPSTIQRIVQFNKDRVCLNPEGPYLVMDDFVMSKVDVPTSDFPALKIQVSIRKGIASKENLVTCTDDSIQIPTNLPEAQSNTLIFLNDGKTLYPDPATSNLLLSLGIVWNESQ